jgi:WD40 repeat protein
MMKMSSLNSIIPIALLFNITFLFSPDAAIHNVSSLGHPNLMVQLAHSANVSSVAFSPNGKYVLLGGYDNIATLWEVDSGRELRSLEGHSDSITSVAFSPDGKRVLTGSWDGTARLWETMTGKEEYRFRIQARVTSVAYSPDNNHILTGSEDRIIRLWDVKSRKESQRFIGHSGLNPSVAFSPDGEYILTGGGHNTIGVTMVIRNGVPVNVGQTGDSVAKLWDIHTGKPVRSFEGHTDSVMAVAFSADGKRVLTGSWDGTARLWETDTGKPLHVFREHSEITESNPLSTTYRCIISVAFSLDGKKVLTGSYGGTARLWDVATETELLNFPVHGGFLGSAAYSPFGEYVLTASGATLWDAATGKPVRTLARLSGGVTSVAYSAKGKYLLVGNTDGTARLWEVGAGRQLNIFEENSGDHRSPIMSVAFSPDEKYVLTGSWDGLATLWDVETGKRVRSFIGHEFSINSVAFSPDGKYALTGGVDFKLRLWDVNTGEQLPIAFYPQLEWITAVSFSPDGKYVFSGSGILVQESDPSKSNLSNLKGAMLTNNSALTFSHDGKYFLTGDRNGVLKMWETDFSNGPLKLIRVGADKPVIDGELNENDFPLWGNDEGKKRRKFKGPSGSITSVAFSVSGKYAVTGEQDGLARLWDVNKGKEIGVFAGHTGKISSVTFSPDEKYVFTGGADGTARLWRIFDQKELCRLVSFRDGSWAAVASDGRFDTNNLESVRGMNWVMPDDPMKALPIEIFMRDYYEPRLLTRLFKGEELPKLPSLTELNRVQPKVEKIRVIPRTDNRELVDVSVEVSSVAGQCLQGGKQVSCESGVYDLRLYRDGHLVARSPAPDPDALAGDSATQGRQAQVQEWRRSSVVKTEDGCAVTAASGKQTITFRRIRLPLRAESPGVEFTAYAFNEDRVKSTTSEPAVYPFSGPRPGRRPRAYVVTVGVDVTSDPNWRLSFAPNGARDLARLLEEKLAPKYEVVSVPLISEYSDNDAAPEPHPAAKQDIHTVLSLLSSRGGSEQQQREFPALAPATPDDLVVIYVASHGYADPSGKFYIIPSDIGEPAGVSEELLDRCLRNSEQSGSCEAAREFLRRSISSDELTQWLQGIDAGQMVLILDSCHSGAVSGPDFKPGPMGDRGFGQLSYDKGMVVLAATQAENVAWGGLELGDRSLLTYALTKQNQTAEQSFDLRQWVSDAGRQVPQLYERFVKREQKLSAIAGNQQQEPALFDFTRRRVTRDDYVP